MARKNKKTSFISSRRLGVIFGGIVLICLCAMVGHSLWTRHVHNRQAALAAAHASAGSRGVNSVDYSPSTPSDNAGNQTRKDNPSAAAPTLDNGPNASPAPAHFTVTVTRAGVVAGQFEVAAMVDGVTSGACTVHITQKGQADITQTNQVTQQDNSYICPVFNIPLSSFPNQGPWQVSVSVLNNGSTASGSWVQSVSFGNN